MVPMDQGRPQGVAVPMVMAHLRVLGPSEGHSVSGHGLVYFTIGKQWGDSWCLHISPYLQSHLTYILKDAKHLPSFFYDSTIYLSHNILTPVYLYTGM